MFGFAYVVVAGVKPLLSRPCERGTLPVDTLAWRQDIMPFVPRRSGRSVMSVLSRPDWTGSSCSTSLLREKIICFDPFCVYCTSLGPENELKRLSSIAVIDDRIVPEMTPGILGST